MKNSYHLRRKGDVVTAVLRGETTDSVVRHLKAELEPLLEASDCRMVALDAAAVSFMNTAGINMLVSFCKTAHTQGKDFVLLRPGEAVRKVLQLVQLLDYFDIRESLPQ